VIEFSNSAFDAESIAKYLRINRGDIWALQKIRSVGKRPTLGERGLFVGGSRLSLSAGASLANSSNFTAVDLNIYEVEQRAGDLRHVALNLHRRTLALASGVIEEPTGTGVHCLSAMSP
jgi:hypothetical protein